MAGIFYNYKFLHKCFRYGSVVTMQGTSLQITADQASISDVIKRCVSIEEVITIMQKNSKILNLDFNRFPQFYIEITLDDGRFILSPELKVLTDKAFKQMLFEPFIKYDIENIREGTIQSIECRLLKCNSVQEQIELIALYLKRPRKRFKKWETKPRVLYLYHSYGESPEKFEINYN